MMLGAPPATAASAMRTTFDERYASDEVMNVRRMASSPRNRSR